ncbi:response regulator [Pseudaquabacterium terrae]|uniref:response regulator n=1 Tax=Pseudaquabacterium terrae TaxID=2732868 RepID=UPI001FE8C49A|nr:response regulator transcription factor [Aquabacterium terrae]
MSEASEAGAVRRLRCFIVEDSAVIRQNLVAMLEDLLPIDVVGHAEDQAQALGWLESADGFCDLLLIDIFLKVGSGLPVLAAAQASGRAGKLVVLSNYATPDIRRRCAALGADRVFDKSSELEELIAYCADIGAGERS